MDVNADLRENLRKAVAQSGLAIKEVSKLSGIAKGTIDNWIGAKPTIPRAPDLVAVARVLSTSVEFLVTGEHPRYFYPKAVEDIVEDLKIISDETALDPIRSLAHIAANRVREAGNTGSGRPPDQQAAGN